MSGQFDEALRAALIADPQRVLVVAGALSDGPAHLSFQERPSQVVMVGRGEHNAVLVAAGLAKEGRVPIVLLHGPQMTGRASALFDAFAEIEELDALLVVVGSLPPGVVAPRVGRIVQVGDPADSAEQLTELLETDGARVLFTPAS